MVLQVVGVYESFLSTIDSGESRVSEKGILQILLDLRFVADILSGGKRSGVNAKEEPSRSMILKTSFRRKQLQVHADSATIEPVTRLISRLSQRLDPIDWAT